MKILMNQKIVMEPTSIFQFKYHYDFAQHNVEFEFGLTQFLIDSGLFIDSDGPLDSIDSILKFFVDESKENESIDESKENESIDESKENESIMDETKLKLWNCFIDGLKFTGQQHVLTYLQYDGNVPESVDDRPLTMREQIKLEMHFRKLFVSQPISIKKRIDDFLIAKCITSSHEKRFNEIGFGPSKLLSILQKGNVDRFRAFETYYENKIGSHEFFSGLIRENDQAIKPRLIVTQELLDNMDFSSSETNEMSQKISRMDTSSKKAREFIRLALDTESRCEQFIYSLFLDSCDENRKLARNLILYRGLTGFLNSSGCKCIVGI